MGRILSSIICLAAASGRCNTCQTRIQVHSACFSAIKKTKKHLNISVHGHFKLLIATRVSLIEKRPLETPQEGQFSCQYMFHVPPLLLSSLRALPAGSCLLWLPDQRTLNPGRATADTPLSVWVGVHARLWSSRPCTVRGAR